MNGIIYVDDMHVTAAEPRVAHHDVAFISNSNVYHDIGVGPRHDIAFFNKESDNTVEVFSSCCRPMKSRARNESE